MNPYANSAEMARAMARVRTEFANRADDPRYVQEQCETCPETFWRRKGRRRHWCPACSAARMVANCDATHNRAGEPYEKIVRAQLAYWLQEANRLNLRLANLF